ncbi:unnamed protein product [Adineta steineri]|uniref:LRAT domain-containing protein n=1 Tax=Adineta steineri TaxID=433720 RepID=A0A820AD38_9BILA|nr:unnamed protein product [Adineta steineri]CAF1087892.1 unnamed protein product [Adineta steineri]CAF1226514.1 unnamed protein product [Adineta steineri]CAF3648739.1 unnamed protein product [Adineta steineri]CAF4186808.1 unnamed protein product [Adineta steineri]
MSFQRTLHDIFLECIGYLAATLALFGIRASNNEFNGRAIHRHRYTDLLQDDMIITRFYKYETLIKHNFVVFQTESGHIFKVHLIANVEPKHYSPMYVKIVPSYWRPGRRRIRSSNKTGRDLKRFVNAEIRRFGNYEVGFNDCRHFANAVAAFLAS